MAIKKKAAKKKIASKKMLSTKAAAANKSAALIASLRGQLQASKTENRELAKKVQTSERQTKVLLKLLEATQVSLSKFLAQNIKDTMAKYGITAAPKKRRRAKKKVAKK